MQEKKEKSTKKVRRNHVRCTIYVRRNNVRCKIYVRRNNVRCTIYVRRNNVRCKIYVRRKKKRTLGGALCLNGRLSAAYIVHLYIVHPSYIHLTSYILHLSSYTELASAVLLVIESVLLEQGVSAFLQAVFSPILRPETHFPLSVRGRGEGFFRGFSGGIDLLQVLPSRGSKGSSKPRDTKLLCFSCSGIEAHTETPFASSAPFRFVLQTAHGFPPNVMTVVIIDPSDAESLCVPFAFVFADLVFLLRVDIGIEIVYHRLYLMCQ